MVKRADSLHNSCGFETFMIHNNTIFGEDGNGNPLPEKKTRSLYLVSASFESKILRNSIYNDDKGKAKLVDSEFKNPR